jgi:hypothetical protein
MCRLGAHDDVALVERGAQCGELVLAQLVLVRERLELALLDEAALGGLLEQALGRRQIVQMNRFAQWDSFFLGRGAAPSPPRVAWPAVGPTRDGPFGLLVVIERDDAGVHSQPSQICDSLTSRFLLFAGVIALVREIQHSSCERKVRVRLNVR